MVQCRATHSHFCPLAPLAGARSHCLSGLEVYCKLGPVLGSFCCLDSLWEQRVSFQYHCGGQLGTLPRCGWGFCPVLGQVPENPLPAPTKVPEDTGSRACKEQGQGLLKAGSSLKANPCPWPRSWSVGPSESHLKSSLQSTHLPKSSPQPSGPLNTSNLETIRIPTY